VRRITRRPGRDAIETARCYFATVSRGRYCGPSRAVGEVRDAGLLGWAAIFIGAVMPVVGAE
jgi:hypothetical protein